MKGYWETRKGEVVRVRDMKDSHILNCMAMLLGKIELAKLGLFVVKYRDFKKIEAEYNEMKREYLRRKLDD